MAPLSLKIVQDGGAITRTVLFDTTTTVSNALEIVKEKVLLEDKSKGKDYGLFLTSADDDLSGVWLEGHRTLDYYMLRDGDSLLYLCRNRNLRVRMLDGSEKTMQIDESKCVGDLMTVICDKIGITNHEEYGLCFEEVQTQEEKPATGTLTLKKKQQTREKDAQMEQLSKKLKTDDNVEWLAQHKTLREIGVDPQQTLLLKRRLFYSDRNVDSRDPVQLNLLYVQTRDAILDGRQVLTEDKAIEFAGIQCQIQYGDFQEDKHKPGFLENLKEFLPEQYAGSWGAERKVFREHSKHQGLSPLEAKHLYTKNARELPTYGVTFFLVKEQQKGKKKLVPRLLGINAESILRLDEVTKEILQVWKLTQVKTFRAGKEMFTLDFGDYSDKQYTVKTNEAHRIRDILQGYIDIIHRSLASPYNVVANEGEVICEDNVQSSKGHIIQNVVPMKLVEHSYVGPSILLPFVQVITATSPGTEAQQGTQVMTVQQIISTKMGTVQQKGIAGKAGVLGNNSSEYLDKLNRLNTYSVSTVAFLTDPQYKRADKVKKVQALTTIIEEDMNSIIEGVHKSVENDNAEVRKKILLQLDELCAGFKDLIDTSHKKDFGTPESLEAAQDAAEKIVGHGTQIHCALDPGIKKRSKILKRSHKSFIEDERTEATLRRASFLAAASHACKAVDGAKEALETTFEGSPPEGHEVDDLEREARKKIGKLSAAVALLMSAQADSNNLDYTAAITSMTTIDELLPELIQDIKALGNVKDERSRISLVSRVRALCDATRNICSLTGEEDKEKIQELALKYAKASDKLIFTLGRGSVPDKENEILDLARDVGDKTTMLLMKVHELAGLAGEDSRTDDLDANVARCDDHSKILLACAQLTAPSITEPHCQSAMTAAAEALTSATQRLAASWKPLVERPGSKMYEESLHAHTIDLMKALDRLKAAYADLSEGVTKDEDPEIKQKERLKFIASMKGTINKILDCQKELDKPPPVSSGRDSLKELQRRTGQRLSLLNSYIANFIRATADRENPDYATAEEAIHMVADVIPDLVRETKIISGTKDDKSGRALINEIRALLEAIRDVCATPEENSMQDTNGAASNFARHSSKLCYAFVPRADHRKENMVIELSKKTCEQASQLLTHVNQLVDEVGGEEGQQLDLQGAKLVDIVQALLTTAQITAPSFDDARCQSTMLGAADDVSSTCQRLADTWTPLVRGAERQELRHNLDTGRNDLETALNNLRSACQKLGEASQNASPVSVSKEEEGERLKFIATVAKTKNKMLETEHMLRKPTRSDVSPGDRIVLESQLSARLAQLNAAIASLVRAASDTESIDYSTAEQSIAVISQVLPDVINDTQSLSSLTDDTSQRAMLRELQKLFDATRDICKFTEQGDTQGINSTAQSFADASEKLCYVFKRHSPSRKDNRIMDLSTEACDKASKLLTSVNQLGMAVGGEDGTRLDDCGIKLVNAAKTMLTTAQILEPSISDPICKSSLLHSVDNVSTASRDLEAVWSPIKRRQTHKECVDDLVKENEELKSALDNLRSVCEAIRDEDIRGSTEEPHTRKIREVNFKSAAPKVNEGLVKVDHLLKDAYKIASAIAEEASELASLHEGEQADRLASSGERVLDTVQFMYSAIAKEVQTPLASRYNNNAFTAIESVAAASLDLAAAYSPVKLDPASKELVEQLELKRSKLDSTLDGLRYAYRESIGGPEAQQDSDETTRQLLTFVRKVSDAKQGLQTCSVEIDNPAIGPEHSVKLSDLQRRAAQRLAQLNAAVASLIQTTSDEDKADYAAGEEAAKSITELMPDIINDIKLLSTMEDDKTRQYTKEQLKTLYEAVHGIYEAVENYNIKNANYTFTKYVEATRNLTKVVDPKANSRNAKRLEDLTRATCVKASQYLADVQSMMESNSKDDFAAVDKTGAKVADAVQNLITIAQITANTMEEDRCKSTLLASIDSLSSSAHDLSKSCSEVVKAPSHKAWKNKLDARKRELDASITVLKAECEGSHGPDGKHAEEQRLKFMSSLSEAKNDFLKFKNELDKPPSPASAGAPPSDADRQRRLAQRLARLNAAIASLIHATGNPTNPDYEEANNAVKTIKECLPHIIQDSKSLTLDDASGKHMTDALKTLCDATRDIYLEADLGRAKNAYEPISKLADATSKLCFVYNPRADLKRENLIIELSKSVCDKASVMLSQVYDVAATSGGQGGELLDREGAQVVDASQLLLTIAQLTASSIDDPNCQSVLLRSVDEVSTLAGKVESTWSALLQEPQQKNVKNELSHKKSDLDKAIRELRAACKDASDVTLKPMKPAVPRRTYTMDQRVHEEKQQFANSVDVAIQNIEDTEEKIRKIRDVESVELPSSEAGEVATQQLERKLVLANVAASHLVICNDPEKMNYKVASKSAMNLGELFPTLVRDTRDLYKSPNLQGKPIVDDSLALCEATRALCRTAKDNNEKLNEVAVDFANKSAKVLYGIGSGVDPEQERQVISRAKVIGDCASRLATCGAAVAQGAGPHAHALCDAGTACADAASKLLYVTKLVAPLIQHPESQSILLTAADQLSSRVKQYSSIWSPLSSQPEQFSSIKDLEVESKSLEKLLDGLKHDIKNETLVRRRKETMIKVENSPMRQLASEILYSYKSYMECSDLPMEERRRFAQDADKLTAAVKELDAANSHSKLAPEDINKLRRLENATQDLQRTLLQTRRVTSAQTNVVDVMDFVKDVVSKIEALSRTAQETNGEYGRKELQMIKEECGKMCELAKETVSPSEAHEHEGLTDDMLHIESFALSCEKTIQPMASATRNIDDAKSRRELQLKLQGLTDCINMLRFAVKGALATADSVALDESLHDLTQLENKIDSMLKPITAAKIPRQDKSDSSAVATLCCVASSPHSSAQQLTPALAAYVTDLRMRTDINDPEEKRRLEEHLRKLLLLLRTLMIATSRRLATWQEHESGEDMIITDQIIQELDDFEHGGKTDGEQRVVDNVDVRRLLLPSSEIHLEGDKNEIKKKFHQTALKLDSMLGTVTSSLQKPQNLSRSLHTITDVAIELDTLARALGNNEVRQNRILSHRIEESAKGMRFATFNLLKVAEQVSKEPDSMQTRRRLLDAIRSLNDSINKLSRVTDPTEGGKELVSSLKLQQCYLHAVQPTNALGYADCLQAVESQADVIYKLKNEETLSREEGYSTLKYITTSVYNTSQYAAQCAYLISISDNYTAVAKEGVPNVLRIQELTESIQDNCVRIMCSGNVNQVKDLQSELIENERQLQAVINESKSKVIDSSDEKDIVNAASQVNTAMKAFNNTLQDSNSPATQISSSTLKILDAIATLNAVVKRPTLLPKGAKLSQETATACQDVVENSGELLNKTVTLVNAINSSKGGVTSWKTCDNSRTALLQAFDALVNSLRENGRRAGLLESNQTPEDEETEVQKKSHVETQMDLARRWLQKENSSEDVRSNGIQGVINVVNIAKQMLEDLNDADKEEMSQTIDEVEKLSMECSFKYSKDKSGLLWERLQELKKMLDRFVVTRVVEDFLEDGTALDDLELLVDVEKDEGKRKYLLELKIAELLAQMSRVTRTARLAADAAPPQVGSDLTQCSQQVELLAPSLVKATQERISSPHHQAIIDKYKALMSEYAESMSKVRILCDRSVDPVDFVQAAGETMQRMRDQSSVQDDPLKSAHTSNLITKLGWRVVEAGLNSRHAAHDAELKRALGQAQRRLQSAAPGAGSRASLQRNWKDVTAEILRTTSEVESALSGENIFQKQLDPNQPIFAAAMDLHAAVREWSARDNEIVGVAKRMAVLMARLSDYMNQDKKREVIATSKAIVKASTEVAALARKLALECSDVRIRTNLLQVCDRIPTISGQLKMLTTVKGASLGHQGNQEDREAINMLVGNAQNLMQSIQEVVAAAAGASVKIMSQRGPRMRWVRKNYYHY